MTTLCSSYTTSLCSMVDGCSQPTCCKNKHFLAKTVATVNPQDKADYTKIKFQFKGVLDQEDFQKYVIGAFDRSERTGEDWGHTSDLAKDPGTGHGTVPLH
jgi:hypothetical protein